MKTKADFQAVIEQSISRYPELATRYYARDPIILQHLEAIATMLAMTLQSVDVAQAEVFAKARDATVLADAAMRGIVPKAKPSRAVLTVSSTASSAVRIESGRILQDARGRPWVVIAGAEIPANGSATLEAEQRSAVEAQYTVPRDEPFHAVAIAQTREDGQMLASVALADAQGEWAYADHYTNVAPDDRVYHIEVDERRRVYLRFGLRGMVGVQPEEGAVFTLRTEYSFGDVVPGYGERFALASIYSPQDAFLSLRFERLAIRGNGPLEIDTLRQLAKYPSVYNSTAVYLGEFDFLVRRHYPTLRFLSLWNERLEEQQRGISVDNINTLFVAVMGPQDSEAVTPAEAGLSQGRLLDDAELSDLQRSIRETMLRADDSYRVRFYTPLQTPMAWRIDAMVGTGYEVGAVKQRLREAVLSRYGIDSMRRGGHVVPVQEVYAHLRAAVPEIAEPGADVTVQLPMIAPGFPPETWHYVTADALDVRVTTATLSPPAWGW